MGLKLANDASGVLSVAIAAGDVTLVLDAGQGAKFPTLAGGDWFPLVLEEGAKFEIVRVTARAVDTLTVARAQEGTTAQAFGIGAKADLRVTEASQQAVLELATPAAAVGALAPKANPVFTGSVSVPDGVFAPAKLTVGAALSLLGVAGNAAAARADIVAVNDHELVRRSGAAIGFGALNLAQAAAVTGILAAANLPDASLTAKGISELATAAEYRAGTDNVRALVTSEVWAGAQASVLTDAATITVSFADGFNFAGASNANLLLGGNRTLGAPSNVKGGQAGILWFGATGATRTLTLNAAWLLMDGVETGPYSITTAQMLGVAYVTRGSVVFVNAILRRAAA